MAVEAVMAQIFGGLATSAEGMRSLNLAIGSGRRL